MYGGIRNLVQALELFYMHALSMTLLTIYDYDWQYCILPTIGIDLLHILIAHLYLPWTEVILYLRDVHCSYQTVITGFIKIKCFIRLTIIILWYFTIAHDFDSEDKINIFENILLLDTCILLLPHLYRINYLYITRYTMLRKRNSFSIHTPTTKLKVWN